MPIHRGVGTSTGSRTSGTTAAEPLVLVDPGNTPSRGDRALIRLTRVGTIIFLASVLVTMTTRRQVSDDWTFAVWLRQKGLLGILPYGYTHFTGRIPLLLFGGLISTWPLALGLAVPLLSLVPATWAVRSLISRFGVGERTVTALAAFLVMGVVAGAPARNQAVFWPIGALVYVIPAAFFVGVVAIVASGSRKPTHVVAAVVCAFAAASGNEIQAVVVPFVLAAMLVNSWSMATSQGRLMRHMLTTARLAPLLAGGVGGLALVGAPGNGGRSEMMIVNV